MIDEITGVAFAAFVDGSRFLEEQPSGAIAVHRLPRDARGQISDRMFGFVEACPVGVSLRFETGAAQVALTLAATTVAAAGNAPEPVILTIRQGVVETQAVLRSPTVAFLGSDGSVFDIRRSDAETVSIPTAGSGPVHVLLPHNARVELHSLRSDRALTAAPPQTVRWTHYGSSISQGMNAVSAARTWPVAAATRLDWGLNNLSFAGNAQLDGCVARVIRDTPADLITLKVGINLVNADSMRERTFRPAVHSFLDTIRDGHPDTPIVLISAMACPIQEEHAGPVVTDAYGRARAAARQVEKDDGALTLHRTREILAEAVEHRSDPRLDLLDGRRLFGTADTSMLYDDLHPDQDGLDLIAERFVEIARAWTAGGTPSLRR